MWKSIWKGNFFVLCRLANENLFIYLKESQMIGLLYDVTEIQPDLSDLSHFVYQVRFSLISAPIHPRLPEPRSHERRLH